jgi:hypothetical protein
MARSNRVAQLDNLTIRQEHFKAWSRGLLHHRDVVAGVYDDGVLADLRAFRFDASHNVDLMI